MGRSFALAAYMVLTGLAGCGDVSRSQTDAAPVPTPDADRGDPRDLSDGDYELRWSCGEGCFVPMPAAVYNRLTVRGSELSFWYRECPTCIVRDSITAQGGCASAAGIPAGTLGATAPYQFCPGAGGPEATISYIGYPGPATIQRVWTVRAILITN